MVSSKRAFSVHYCGYFQSFTLVQICGLRYLFFQGPIEGGLCQRRDFFTYYFLLLYISIDLTFEICIRKHKRLIISRAGAMNLNLVVPTVANLKIEWFHFTKSQKSSGSIAPFSKLSGSTEPLEPPLKPALQNKKFYHGR